VQTFADNGGSLDADFRTFWHKNLRNLWYVRMKKGGGGLSSADIFRKGGRGVNFSRYYADVFYGRPQKGHWDVVSRLIRRANDL